MTTCPTCNKGELKEAELEEVIQDVSLGKFKGEVCTATLTVTF